VKGVVKVVVKGGELGREDQKVDKENSRWRESRCLGGVEGGGGSGGSGGVMGDRR
jgi:hypothetical protein